MTPQSNPSQRQQAYPAAPRISADRARRDLAASSKPFRSILAINAPLSPDPSRPLRDFVAGAWPSYGELERLISAVDAAIAAMKAT